MNRMLSLIQTVKLFIKTIGVKYGVGKRAMIVTRRGQVISSGGFQSTEGQTLNNHRSGENVIRISKYQNLRDN